MSDKPIEGKEYLIKLKSNLQDGAFLTVTWIEDENAFDDNSGNGIYLHEVEAFILLDLALHAEEMIEALKELDNDKMIPKYLSARNIAHDLITKIEGKL